MKKLLILSSAFVLAILYSCKPKDDPKPSDPTNSNESELITSLALIITNGGSFSDTVYFRDLDGEGGNEPEIETIELYKGGNYSCEIVLLDETKSPADTISEEVKEEAEEHQFFYSVTGDVALTASYASGDVDANNVPLGLLPVLSTSGSGDNDGSLTITLKHQGEDKPTSGQGDANIGDTDIEITFPVVLIEE